MIFYFKRLEKLYGLHLEVKLWLVIQMVQLLFGVVRMQHQYVFYYKLPKMSLKHIIQI